MKCIEIIRQIVLSSALRDEPSVMNKLVLRYKTYAINIGLPHYHAKANIFDLLCTHLQLRRLACRIHHRAMTWHCKSAFDIDGLWWLLIDAIFHHIVKFAAIPHCNIILFDVNLIFEYTLFDITYYYIGRIDILPFYWFGTIKKQITNV